MGRGAGGGGGKTGTTRGVKWRTISGKSSVAKKKFEGAPEEHIEAVKEVRMYKGTPSTPSGAKTEGYHAMFSDTLNIREDASPWTYRHELGHLVAGKFLSFDQKMELDALYESEMARTQRGAARRDNYYNDRWITRYAATGAGEMFAEAYSIMTIPGGPNREALQTKMERYAPNVAAFVGNVL